MTIREVLYSPEGKCIKRVVQTDSDLCQRVVELDREGWRIVKIEVVEDEDR